jgi:hypothetical protein
VLLFLQHDTTRFDDALPQLDFARGKRLQVGRRPAIGSDDHHTYFPHSLFDRWRAERSNHGLAHLVHHRLRRALWQEQTSPEIGMKAC